MAKLTDPEKQFIVEKLAEFCSHAEVARLLKSEFDVVVDRFQVRTLDPSHPRYAGSEKWREIFEVRRAAYLGTFEDVPIASDAFRMRQLQEFFVRAKDGGNMGLSLKILKQADEMASKISAKIPPNMIPRPAYMDLTPDERRAQVAEMLRQAALRGGLLDENGRIRAPVN